MNDRPVWVGIVMKTADGRVVAWEMNEPLTIQVSQEMSRNWHVAGPYVKTEFRISGGTSTWHEGAKAAPVDMPRLEGPRQFEIESEG